MDFLGFILDVATSLLVAAITGFVAFIFTKRYYKKIELANRLKAFGFSVIRDSKLTRRELKHMFSNASSIKIMYVAGANFLKANKNLIQAAQKRKQPPEIRFLLAQKGSSFLKEINEMEISFGNRDKDINADIDEASNLLKEMQIEHRYFNGQYRLPIILANYNAPNGFGEVMKTEAWLTVTLPPYKSKESLILKGEIKNSGNRVSDFDFIEMMETHFDYVWEQSYIPHLTDKSTLSRC